MLSVMAGNRPLIFIFDDDPNVVEMLVFMLASQGQIVAAQDSDAAMRMLQELVPDLVLVDLVARRNRTSGTDIIRMLRADSRTQAKPIIAMSAGNADVLQGAHEAGADLIIRKPFDLRRLKLDVQALLAPVAS